MSACFSGSNSAVQEGNEKGRETLDTQEKKEETWNLWVGLQKLR